ncbi:hypothetical protein [Parerythrobacter aestuarii]|uniref:hypothetical protein n=1 Tax=Parerythrobacter aestuarii TaxID=3020909 RepID=UPI0024DE30DA|nr:hypothetical protein [Parerythrobacter aestuarii]
MIHSATTLRTLATAMVGIAALAAPAQASAPESRDRASANAPVCVFESKLAAEQRDMNRGTCFTVGVHEDTHHAFYNSMESRYAEYVTVAPGHFVVLSFRTGGHGKLDHVMRKGTFQLNAGRRDLAKVSVFTAATGRINSEAKACLYKEKGWYDLYRRSYARCFPGGEYPDVSLPQFDAKGWFKYLELSKGYSAILYTGKNFTGTSMTIRSGGKIIPPKPPRPGRIGFGGRGFADWLDRIFPSTIQSIKIVRTR